MRVLIVEDDTAVRDMLRLHLSHLGYEVALAADGEAAWDLLQRVPVRLVVADWMMPRLDGVQLTQRIRANSALPYTYVILLTARNEVEDRVNGLFAGADDYMIKPFNLDELQARLVVGERTRDIDATARGQPRDEHALSSQLGVGRGGTGSLDDAHQHTGFPPRTRSRRLRATCKRASGADSTNNS